MCRLYCCKPWPRGRGDELAFNKEQRPGHHEEWSEVMKGAQLPNFFSLAHLTHHPSTKRQEADAHLLAILLYPDRPLGVTAPPREPPSVHHPDWSLGVTAGPREPPSVHYPE
ncbi:unnamed protein product [Eretmochelys imbricata]